MNIKDCVHEYLVHKNVVSENRGLEKTAKMPDDFDSALERNSIAIKDRQALEQIIANAIVNLKFSASEKSPPEYFFTLSIEQEVEIRTELEKLGYTQEVPQKYDAWQLVKAFIESIINSISKISNTHNTNDHQGYIKHQKSLAQKLTLVG